MDSISGTQVLEVAAWLFAIGAATVAALIATNPRRERVDIERTPPDSHRFLSFCNGCHSCGSLLPKVNAGALMGIKKRYCGECVDSLGKLKPYAEVHVAMVDLLQSNGRSRNEAAVGAHRYLSLMPAWVKRTHLHPHPCNAEGPPKPGTMRQGRERPSGQEVRPGNVRSIPISGGRFEIG